MKPFAISILVLAALSACDSETKSEPEPATSQPAPAEPAVVKPIEPAAPAPVAKAEAEPPADLPVPADFEQEAETSITKANYGKELSMLEKEIDSDATK